MAYLGVLGRETIKTFLNDMIAIQILDELYHFAVESMDDSLNLLGRRDEFYHFL